MSCLFEPIHGRFPTNSICDSYPDCVGCSYSDPFKQPKQTNADRIRNMTDEELVEYLYGICDCDHADVPCKEHCGEMPCRDAWMKWLKQEANNDKV